MRVIRVTIHLKQAEIVKFLTTNSKQISSCVQVILKKKKLKEGIQRRNPLDLSHSPK